MPGEAAVQDRRHVNLRQLHGREARCRYAAAARAVEVAAALNYAVAPPARRPVNGLASGRWRFLSPAVPAIWAKLS